MLNADGPKETMLWGGGLAWVISTELLVVLSEKRDRKAKAVLDRVKQERFNVVAREDDASFVGSAGKLAPEHRLAHCPSRLEAIEKARAIAGVLKRP